MTHCFNPVESGLIMLSVYVKPMQNEQVYGFNPVESGLIMLSVYSKLVISEKTEFQSRGIRSDNAVLDTLK